MDQVAEKDEKRTFEIKSSLKFHLASVIKFDLFHFKLEKMVVNNLEQFMTPFLNLVLYICKIFSSLSLAKSKHPFLASFFVMSLLYYDPLKFHWRDIWFLSSRLYNQVCQKKYWPHFEFLFIRAENQPACYLPENMTKQF